MTGISILVAFHLKVGLTRKGTWKPSITGGARLVNIIIPPKRRKRLIILTGQMLKVSRDLGFLARDTRLTMEKVTNRIPPATAENSATVSCTII